MLPFKAHLTLLLSDLFSVKTNTPPKNPALTRLVGVTNGDLMSGGGGCRTRVQLNVYLRING